MRLSLPPEANRYFSSLLKERPYHSLGTVSASSCFSLRASKSWMLCTLCPLFVTATYFPVLLTAIFRGRSPRGRLLPTGVRLQPLGSFTLPFSISGNVWEK